MTQAIRTCVDCGLEAFNEEELSSFVKDSSASYGRRNLCGACVNARNRKSMAKNDKTHLKRIRRTMIRRCHDKESKDFKNYGGRGITVCREWRDDCEVFVKWALTNGFQRGLTIDRIKNNLGYYPDNCHWVSRQSNNRNKRNIVTNFESDTRKCCACDIEKPLSDFHASRYKCKSCVSDYDRIRYAKKKRSRG